jgi:polar amino acid transport system permease protein
VELAVLSQVTGIILGVLAALGRMSRIFLVRWFIGLYLWIFRGTPLLVQLFFVYFAVPQFTNETLILSEFMSAYVAFSLNEGAYMAEIVRAGIASVDFGQMEAASSLGMTRGLAMRRVILPQAVRIIIPPTGNEFVSMLKNTSLASTIAVTEIFYQTDQVRSATFHAFEPLAVVSLWYLAMTTVANYMQSFLEDYFGRGFTREAEQPGFMQRMLTGTLRRG